MELVSLNPDLGSYFSTDHGVLVVRAPSDAETGLRGGDVILKIGDEAPTTPANAIRMLRSSDSDEPVRLLVLRKGEKVTVATKSLMARRPLREAPPAPPTPPAAPRPRPGSKESL
jgi:S1-C subfamily serine protease